MTRVLIVDDELLAADRLRRLCARIDGVDVTGTASDGAEALRLVGALQPDLVLLDITMPGLDGFAVAHAVRATGRMRMPAIVFVTAHACFAVDAFDVDATDYLLKPVSQERLARAIAKANVAPRQPALAEAREWWGPNGSGLVRIAAGSVDLVEAERDYVRLHVGNRSFLLRDTLTRLEHRLAAEGFLRVHRSALVPRGRMRAVRRDGSEWRIDLVGGRTVTIGRTYLPQLRATLPTLV